ncbi:trypsin-like serine peptidase [Streptomyces sp. NPDC002851]
MAAAKPAEAPTPSAAELRRAAAHESVPSKEPRSAPGAASSRSKTAAPAADAKELTEAERWGQAGTEPARTTGQFFFVDNDGNDSACSASVITAENRNTVWTAGHCVHPGEGGEDDFYDLRDMAFVPDNDGDQEPHGLWEATYAAAPKGWTEDGSFEYDVAAVQVAPQPRNGDLQPWTGAQGYRFGYGQEFSDVTVLGYPAAGNGRNFPGDQLYYCNGDTEDRSVLPWVEQLQIECDMGQGSSGGPWLDDLSDDGIGYIVGATSNIPDPDPNDPDNDWDEPYMRSSNHGDAAINVYEKVSKH